MLAERLTCLQRGVYATALIIITGFELRELFHLLRRP